MISYEGIFFESEVVDFIHQLERNRLPIVNDEIHCTFKYHPKEDEIFDELVGKEIEVSIVGYGCDGKNSGFEIELPVDMMQYYINYDDEELSKLRRPHITASLALGAKSVDTKDLKFERFANPYKVKGKFGYWIKEENGEYISYDKLETFNDK